MRAWHFVGDTLRDGRPVPPDGYKLIHDGPVVPCERGLHASLDPFDALKYAPGPILCLVEVGGTPVAHGSPVDKLASNERTIIVRADITDALRWYARQQALKVAHLWDPPPAVVLDYLVTGDESLQDAARAAAWDAAWDAAEAAAWAAARDAAEAAARAAARAAAWDAARAAARDAAEAAARAAAWDAARDAAWDAAWDAAEAAARAEFNDMIRDMYAVYLEN